MNWEVNTPSPYDEPEGEPILKTYFGEGGNPKQKNTKTYFEFVKFLNSKKVKDY